MAPFVFYLVITILNISLLLVQLWACFFLEFPKNSLFFFLPFLSLFSPSLASHLGITLVYKINGITEYLHDFFHVAAWSLVVVVGAVGGSTGTFYYDNIDDCCLYFIFI